MMIDNTVVLLLLVSRLVLGMTRSQLLKKTKVTEAGINKFVGLMLSGA